MKDEILQKAFTQFTKHGTREMSNDKLVELLGISTKTLYKYFKNKEELLEEVLDLFYTQHRETWKELYASSKNSVTLFCSIWHTAIEIEYRVNKAFYQDLHHYYPELLHRKEAALEKEHKKQFIQIICRGADEGFFQKNIHPEIIFRGISVLFDAIIWEEQFKTFRVSADEIFLNTIAHYIRGFCTKRGVEELDVYIQNLMTSSKMSRSKRLAL